MHEDAGLRRRRRMLLLFPQPKVPPAPPLIVAPASEAEQPICVDAELFAASSGDDRVVLQVEDLARRVLREEPLNRPILAVGRGPDNDLWLDHERILPRHLILLWLEGGVFFITPSAEAQVLEGKRPVRSGWWSPGLCLRVGAFRLRMQNLWKSPPNFDPLTTSAALEAELPRLELRFLSRKRKRPTWPVRRPLTLVGRSSICKIRLDLESILPVQAALIRTDERLWLVNFGSADQVRVNELPVLSAVLDVGDVLQIAKLRIEVQTASEWPAEAAPEANTPLTSAAGEPTSSDQTVALLRQFLDQHRKLLATHQQALGMLEHLADQTSNPEQIRSMIDRLRGSVQLLDEDGTLLESQVQQPSGS